ncbi:MAG: TolC family protein, partial [Kiritimatiellae bacterium]|nr:TolC family protein [Kiritimatiellia bacterium]
MRTLHAVVAAAALGAFGIVTAGARTLEKCIETALEASPDAQAASYRVDAARAAIEQAESGYYPVLTLSSTYARTDNPPQAFMMALNQRALNMADPAFNPNEPDDTENIRLSAGVKYRLFDAGRRGLGRGMAKSGEEAARAGLAAVRNELIHQVTRGYYGVLQAQAFVQVQEENVHSLKESLRVAGERHAAGSAVKTDV